jgi:hypothetical protein
MMPWQSGRTWHPLSGLLTGLALTAACLVLPSGVFLGRIALGAVLLMTFVLYLPPPKAVLQLVALAAVIYAPMLVFLPGATVLQGVITTMVAVLSIGMLGYPALHDAVAHLALPRLVKLLLLQILHQTSVLSRETAKIRQAMVVRGAVPRGFSGLQFLHALPRVWIPRVIFKSNRVAHALELRGYGMPVPGPRPHNMHKVDYIGVLTGAVTLGVGVAMRCVR